MIYLDNAATTLLKPLAVARAVAEAIGLYANPARGAYESSLNALRCTAAAREELSSLFGVGDSARVAFALNATAALNVAISGIHGHIVTTAAEHNSVLRPVYRNGNYTIVPTDTAGRLRIDDIAGAIRPDTAAVVMTHASNVTGNVYDITRVGELCGSRGIAFILDAAQSAGILPIDMQSMGISALCFSGHKALYGPQGTGGICLRTDFLPEPLIVGGSGFSSFEKTHPVSLPEALEAGTQNAHGIAGLLAGVRYLSAAGVDAADNADALARRFVEGVRGISQIVLYGDLDAALRVPVVSLNCRGMDSAELAGGLNDRYNISVRAGVHCAPLMHEALGTKESGAVRFSFSSFNTAREVETAIDALREICK